VLARNDAMRAEKSQAVLKTGQNRHKKTPSPEPPFMVGCFVNVKRIVGHPHIWGTASVCCKKIALWMKAER